MFNREYPDEIIEFLKIVPGTLVTGQNTKELVDVYMAEVLINSQSATGFARSVVEL